jgi:hypothetical protein
MRMGGTPHPENLKSAGAAPEPVTKGTLLARFAVTLSGPVPARAMKDGKPSDESTAPEGIRPPDRVADDCVELRVLLVRAEVSNSTRIPLDRMLYTGLRRNPA